MRQRQDCTRIPASLLGRSSANWDLEVSLGRSQRAGLSVGKWYKFCWSAAFGDAVNLGDGVIQAFRRASCVEASTTLIWRYHC